MSDSTPRRLYRERIYGSYVSAFKGRPTAADVEKEFLHHGRFFDHLLRPVLRRIRPNVVLDVGCGQGRFMSWAVGRGMPDVRGFDLSAEQVAVAASLGLRAEVATAQEYLSRGGEFDLVVAMDILEHFGRDEALAFLEQCLSCLRPGGMVFLTTPNGAALRAGPIVYGDLTHETIFTPQTIALALRLSGFEDISVWEVTPAPHSLRSRLRLVLWRLIRLVPAFVDIVEKGTQATHVYSRVLAAQGRRPAGEGGTRSDL